MASAVVKKPCAKCSKGAAVATCDGCQQSLCIKHFNEHRQELSNNIENVGQEHDLLQRDLNQQNAEHPLLLQINTWERESIAKIQVAAEAARADLQNLLDRSNKELKKSVTIITNELQSCREADDYTEIDINKWTEQLQAIRKTLESPSAIVLHENQISESIIRLISVHDQQQHRSTDCAAKSPQYLSSTDGKSTSSVDERFDVVDGDGMISEEGLVGTCMANSIIPATTVYGRNEYSSGTHRIHFRIEKIGGYRNFLGICRLSEKMRIGDEHGKSHYGWWDLNRVVVNGKKEGSTGSNVVTTGDEMILTLDCDNRQIQLHHLRTNQRVLLTIDLKKCPFPWIVVTILIAKGNSIRILQ